MPLGSAASQGSSGEDYSHIAGVRYRVRGAGVLRTTLYSDDEVLSKTLGTITMATSPGKQPFMVTNFMAQRTKLRFETTAINETFRISRIVVFMKPTYTMMPN